MSRPEAQRAAERLDDLDVLRALGTVLAAAFEIRLNMNDTFGAGTADEGWLDAKDAIEILPVIKQHGRAALVAYESLRRELLGRPCAPLPEHATPPYKAAREWLRELMSGDNAILWQDQEDQEVECKTNS